MSFARFREIAEASHRWRAPQCVRAGALVTALVAGVVLAGPGGALLAAPSARQEVAAGWGAFGNEEWGEAEAAFRRAVEADPELAEAYKGLAETLSRQNREREAAQVIRDGLPHLGDTPADSQTRLEFARRLAWSGHHREALEQCERLQEKGTKKSIRSAARLLEAQVLSWSGRTREAEAKYEAILADGPSAEAEVGLGDMDRWEGRYAEADTHYRAALDVDPKNAQALQGREGIRRDAGPALTIRAGVFDSSPDFRRDTYTLFADLFRARRLSLRTGAARMRYDDGTGRQVYRTAIPVQGRYWASRSVSLRGGIAFNDYSEPAPDTTSWFLHGDLSPGEDRVRVRVGIHHYDVIDDSDPLGENFYNQAETIDVALQKVSIDELRVGMLVRLTDRMSLDGDLADGDLSDDNERAMFFGRLSYRLPGDPRVDLYGSFFWENVENPSLIYWDPKNFQSWSLGARVEGDVEERFRYIADGRLSFHPREEDLLGWQIYGLAEWDLGEDYILRLTGNYLVAPVSRGLSGGRDYDATYLSVGLVRQFGAPAAAKGR